MTTTDPSAATDETSAPIPWQGLNHLALTTTDMDATTRFWHEALGAPLIATIGTESFRHYFFQVGEGNAVAFFEYQGAKLDSFAKPAGIPDKRAVQFDHLSLDLPDEAAVLRLAARLRAHDVEVTEVVDHGIMRSIYFTDPNGIALEASYWAEVPTPESPSFGDENPVDAAAQIANGDPVKSPATRLVDYPTANIDDWLV